MNIPKSNRKKALIIVDVQSVFLNRTNKKVLGTISNIIEHHSYDLYVNAVFYADKNSIWKKQTNWSVNKNKAKTHSRIQKLLDKKDKDIIIDVMKKTKSVFKGWVITSPMLLAFSVKQYLDMKSIEEVHIIGLDTNDCVLATAYEAFDLGFFTYVIEECTQSSEGNAIHSHAISLLRHVGLTNNK